MQADKYQLQTTEIPKRAFGKVSINLIVDLPLSHNGNKNILVMVDQLTSWPIARAIPDKEATTIANAVYRDLILQHGAPEILLSDNGKEFSNDTLAYVCEEHGIKQHFTSPYVTSTVFESKDDPTQMTKAVIYNYILYYIQKTIHSILICTNVHS